MSGMTEQRVLQIVSSLGMGGAETWLACLVEDAQADLPQIDFLVTSGQQGHFDQRMIEHGCQIHYLKFDRSNLSGFIRGFRRVLSDNTYIAVHDHQDLLSGWHFLFGWGLLPPVAVAHFHNPIYQVAENYGVSFRRRFQLFIGRWLLARFATDLLGTSADLLQKYEVTRLIEARKVRALSCGINVARWQGDVAEARAGLRQEFGLPNDCKVVLFVGRLDYSIDTNHPQNHKNSAFALEVFSRLSTDSTTVMIMAGRNDYIADEFVSLAHSLGVAERLILAGVRDDTPALMLGADVLLFPSRDEGLGMVAVEAQAAGLPVLASDAVPGECVVLDELVTFYSLENDAGCWSVKLADLLEAGRGSSTGNHPAWAASGYNIDVCAERLGSIYRGQA